MMKKLRVGLVLAALAVGGTGCIIHVVGDPEAHHYKKQGWLKLGERTVDFKQDHDVVHVGAVEGTFRAIGIHVSGAPANMHGIRVIFGDDTIFEPAIRHHFGPDSWSRNIDLPGGNRVIRRVEFNYGSDQRHPGHSRVQLFGQH